MKTMQNNLFQQEGLLSLITLPSQIMEHYYTDEFVLKDLGISSKTFFGWIEQELTNNERDGKNRRFNLIEYVWICIVKDLREFGFSRNKIKMVKDYLFKEYALKDYLKDLRQEDILKALNKLNVKNGDAEIISMIKSGKYPKELKERKFCVLFLIILQFIHSKHNIQFMIDMDGYTLIYDDFYLNNSIIDEVQANAWITLPLSKYFKPLFTNKKYTELLSRTRLANENELHILSLIRTGKAHSITIRFKDEKPFMLEVETSKKLIAEARLSDILLKGGYEEITLKTQAGDISYTNVKTKMKL